MQTQKKTDRKTTLNNLSRKVNNLVADAEKFALNAGVSADALRARRFETQLDELFKNQENLNAELLTSRNEQLPLQSQVTTKRVTFAVGVPNSSLDQTPILRAYAAESQERERSLPTDFPPITQRLTVRENEPVNRRRFQSPSFTPGYSNQAESVSTREIFMIVSLLIALFLLLVANNGLQNNSTAPKFNP